MARVNVEQKALTDPRFLILGSRLDAMTKGARDTIETAYGLYQMIRVWNYCLERGLLSVYARDLDALHEGLSAAMIDAQLGEIVRGSRPRLVRIKGGDGLLDWLEKKRLSGREHGAKGAEHGIKGGRPPKTEKPGDPVSENGVRGFENNPPPAPAPAPAPAQRQKRAALFVPPTVKEVSDYCRERSNNLDAAAFVAFYSSKGWMVGKNKMVDWRKCVQTWERREAQNGKATARVVETKSETAKRLAEMREYDTASLQDPAAMEALSKLGEVFKRA